MDPKVALDRAEDAADAAEAAATRLQQKTSGLALDDAAEKAKDIVHDVREALEDMEEKTDESMADEQAAKVAEAASAVEQELKEMAAELAEATDEATGSSGTAKKPEEEIMTSPNFKTTKQAVRELELLAEKKAQRNIQGRTIVVAIWAFWLVIIVAIIRMFGLAGTELAIGGSAGLLWGLAGSAMYNVNRRWKRERNQRLAMIPGAKGIQSLVHHIPSWLNFSATEKMEWLNRILAKSWPYYDAAICAEVKKQVEPLMEQFRPPFIKRIFFKKLTFGDAPFRIEGIRVEEKQTDKVQIEVDFRWAGDANIFLAIELPAGGAATRMVPKVSDMAVSGTARIILSPLLPEIPGFGAAIVSLMKPPVVKFHLDFGAAFGGSYTANLIVSWLDPFLRSTVAGMLVWPKRIVVPILGEDVCGPLDDLFLRHKGALQVDVLSAEGIPKMDRMGTADCYVEMYTQSTTVEKTSVKKNTLTPKWGERLWMLVQEPLTQFAYVTVNDVDFVNLKELMRVNVLKGATNVFGAKELVGRSMLRISDFENRPTEPVEVTLPLGLDEFNNEDGCGGGRGELKLSVTYWPLEKMGGHKDARFGALIVTLLRCDNLPIADIAFQSSDPFVKFSCNKESQASPIVWSNLNPKWVNCMFDWFKVPAGEDLEVAVWDKKTVPLPNRKLGDIKIDVHNEVACAPGGDITKTYNLEHVLNWNPSFFGGKLGSGANAEVAYPSVTLRMQWIPFT